MASVQDCRDIPTKVAQEADVWFVQLGNPQVTADQRAAFQAWLSQDPLHQRAFQETSVLWAQLDEPVARLARASAPFADRPVSTRRPLWGYLALVATVLAIVVAGTLAWRDPGVLERALADYATQPGERRDIVLSDGSRLFLDGDTAVTVQFSPDARFVSLLRGRAWFDVKPEPDRPFTVSAGSIDTRVLGTAFSVDRDTGKVVVERGLVSVMGEPGNSARLTAGQAVSAMDGQLGVPEVVDPASAISWRRGLIVLDAAPLGGIAQELHHMAPGRLVIPDGSLRKLTISGVFKADDPDAVIEAMRTALGLKTITIPGLATVVYR